MQSKASGRELGLHSALSLAGCTCTCPDRIEHSHWSRRRLPRPIRGEKTVLQQWGAGPVRRSFSCPPGWLSQNSRLLNITLARDPNITTPASPHHSPDISTRFNNKRHIASVAKRHKYPDCCNKTRKYHIFQHGVNTLITFINL